MNMLVCIKRVPDTGAKIELTEDEQAIETRNLGFTISPHEECAVEEAVQLIGEHGGRSTVLTLGPEEAVEQLRDSIARGMDRGVLLETDRNEWDPSATARAIVEAVRAQQDEGSGFNLLLFGNEAADTGDYQVGVRVAEALDLPCVTGIKGLEIREGTAIAKREISGGWEIFEVSLPAVFTVKEGINLPRRASLRGMITAKKKPIDRIKIEPQRTGSGFELEKVRLKEPEERGGQVKILGEGPQAAPKIVEVLRELEVL
ncbi:MAG: electron transfer flavoprotein subunit beta/FixA family protein [Candidatus Bipolaricaulia bacterium]